MCQIVFKDQGDPGIFKFEPEWKIGCFNFSFHISNYLLPTYLPIPTTAGISRPPRSHSPGRPPIQPVFQPVHVPVYIQHPGWSTPLYTPSPGSHKGPHPHSGPKPSESLMNGNTLLSWWVCVHMFLLFHVSPCSLFHLQTRKVILATSRHTVSHLPSCP